MIPSTLILHDYMSQVLQDIMHQECCYAVMLCSYAMLP